MTAKYWTMLSTWSSFLPTGNSLTSFSKTSSQSATVGNQTNPCSIYTIGPSLVSLQYLER